VKYSPNELNDGKGALDFTLNGIFKSKDSSTGCFPQCRRFAPRKRDSKARNRCAQSTGAAPIEEKTPSAWWTPVRLWAFCW